MEKFTTEGVVVNATPFRNYDCILTVFTPLDGLVKFFCKAIYKQKKGNHSGTTTSLAVVEIIYTKGRGDLYLCVEISVVNHHLALRNNLSVLEAACKMLHSLAATQQPGKSAPELYQLFLMYLNKLPQAQFPPAIARSFLLKLLRYEGLLAFISHCSTCGKLLKDAWIHESEAYCPAHMPSDGLSLNQEERSLVEHLAFSRDFTQIACIQVSPSLSEKISYLFDKSFKFNSYS